jgi:uncharacterized protein (TIGR02996 family)
MPDQKAFLQAIRDAPEDDAVRLVYSDWLEEQGQDARAEFIRVQCALARCPRRSSRRKGLAARVDELWRQFEDQWLREDLTACGLWELAVEEYPGEPESADDLLCVFGFLGWEYQRGFLAELRGSVTTLLSSLPCLDRLPPLETLYLMEVGPKELGKLLRWPGLAHVSTLRLHRWDDFDPNDLGNAGACALARATTVSRLVSLSLGETGVGDAGVEALAASPYLSRLEELYLDTNEGIGPAGAWALVHSRHLLKLRRLDLSGMGVSAGDSVLGALRQRFEKVTV